MPGVVESPATPVAAPQAVESLFQVAHQKVWLNINPLNAHRAVNGSTEITITPLSAELRTVKLHCRQARITRCSTSAAKGAPTVVYSDPYKHARLPGHTDAHQWHMLQDRLENELKAEPEPELIITLPKSLRLQERASDTPGEGLGRRFSTDNLAQTSSVLGQSPAFNAVTINIEFTIDNVRDGLQFVGCNDGDLRYPQVFTQATARSAASSLFPCLDDESSRCSWDVSVRCPKTIGDALSTSGSMNLDDLRFSEEDKARDFVVVCSGEMTDEITEKSSTGFKTTSFHIDDLILPRHIGFAIAPFELVNLAAFRESQEDEKLGKSATPIHGFCLPGRAEWLKNTCFPLAKAVDFFLMTYGAYPFSSYKVAFVDDMIDQTTNTAALTLCSNRMLFPEDILEPIDRVTRQLAFAAAAQWVGVNMVPQQPSDAWITVGLAGYMADVFLRKLCGNNDYRYRQKAVADRITEMDIARPSLHETGAILHLDPSQMEFLALKAPLVMFILDRRMIKSNGTSGLVRIVSKILLANKTGDLLNGALSTSYFIRMCEKVAHSKLDTFFNQWVFGAGCPHFQITQRFNKKRLVVEMQISQVQREVDGDPLRIDSFMRDVKEEVHGVYAGTVQPVFTGPMTIRIHEADGTPYEHIVEIKEKVTRFEIPYNTKYKRLKRTRRQKERLVAGGPGTTAPAEGEESSLLYCFGDILQTDEEMAEWRIVEWTKEEEERMNAESFEWIRMDADFEWICRLQTNMPHHMYLSQLQQDRDVVAQVESIQFFANVKENALVSTFLVRTLMDRRYYHGVRAAAALALTAHAKDEVQWVGFFHLEKAFTALFCLPSGMVRPNDFEDRALHNIQCAMVRVMARIRDNSGRAPLNVRKFLYEKLRYNNNSRNQRSDTHYVQALIKALAGAVASAPPLEADVLNGETQEDDVSFFRDCLTEIDRHRRLDEWLPSYQNILSMEGMNAKAELMRHGLLPRDAREFLQYTQITTYGELRVAAFDCLIELGFGLDARIMRWLLFNLGSDPSPHMRRHLFRIFGRWLGMIAIGQHYSEKKPQESGVDGLIIEAEVNTAGIDAEEARKKTVPGAIAAMKKELGSQQALKTELWAALSSGVLNIPEIGALLELCSLLYEAETRLLLKLKYPRYWKAERIEKDEKDRRQLTGGRSCMMRFTQTDHVRTKTQVRWQAPVANVKLEPKTSSLKRKSSLFEPMAAPATKLTKKSPTPLGNAGSPPPDGKKNLKLKLKIGAGLGGSGGGNQSPASASQTPVAQTPGGTQRKLLKLNVKPPTPRAGQ